jgi:hypothetical protein
MRNRREIEGISLSFLDVISCGFGAIILLLVLTKVFEPVVIEDTISNLEGYLAALQEELFDLRGEAKDINRKMIRKEDQQSEEIVRLLKLNAELSALKSKHEKTLDKTKVSTLIEGKLAEAKQSLTDEMKKLLVDYQPIADENKIGGIPVDSEYIIFIIDTSPSMRNRTWPLVLQKVAETLAVYPTLEGIQVMSDNGSYMFSQYAGDWIPDTPEKRRDIIHRLRDWDALSNSSPVTGITKAISTYYKPGLKISLYVFGDDFQGRSVQNVVDAVDRINPADSKGNRLVRIHAVAFPVIFELPAGYHNTVKRFSHLMRTLCEKNGGTFVALNDIQAY